MDDNLDLEVLTLQNRWHRKGSMQWYHILFTEVYTRISRISSVLPVYNNLRIMIILQKYLVTFNYIMTELNSYLVKFYSYSILSMLKI